MTVVPYYLARKLLKELAHMPCRQGRSSTPYCCGFPPFNVYRTQVIQEYICFPVCLPYTLRAGWVKPFIVGILRATHACLY